MGWKLSKFFHSCLNVVLPESGGKEGRLLKLLVELDLDKPLLRGTKLKLDNEVILVDFGYEQLPWFCFYCERIGHREKHCEAKMSDSRERCICEDQYSEWLRSLTAKGVQTDQIKRTKTLKLRSEEVQGLNEVRGDKLGHQKSNQLEGSEIIEKEDLRRITW